MKLPDCGCFKLDGGNLRIATIDIACLSLAVPFKDVVRAADVCTAAAPFLLGAISAFAALSIVDGLCDDEADRIPRDGRPMTDEQREFVMKLVRDGAECALERIIEVQNHLKQRVS